MMGDLSPNYITPILEGWFGVRMQTSKKKNPNNATWTRLGGDGMAKENNKLDVKV